VTGSRAGRPAPRRVVRNLGLLAGVAWRHAQDDPALLAVQAMRRLPIGIRGRSAQLLQRHGPSGAVQALGFFLADRSDDARALLVGARSRTGIDRRLAAELSVQLGQEPPVGARPSTAARAQWSQGHLTEALAILSAAPGPAAVRQHARLAADRRIMTPGFAIRAASAPVAVPAASDGPRVLHLLTNSLPKTTSGYALRSHAILRAQRESGIEVEAVTVLGYPVTVGLPGVREAEVIDGVTYRRLIPTRLGPTSAARLAQTAELLISHVERFRPTVLHTTTHFTNALVIQAVAQATGLPWVYEVRGQLEKTWAASRSADAQAAALLSERFRLWHAKETEMALAADHVVVLSGALRQDLVQRGVPEDRITVVPNAVDADLLGVKTSPAEARYGLGLPADGFWVGTVSSLVPYEGLDTLLEAVALLRARGLDVRCALVGDGTARPGLLAQVERLGLGHVVVLPGRVDHRAAADWHRALDVFVVPRQDTDVGRAVTPLKPIEAMAAGRPVVASDLPALAEIITGPGTGLLVRPDDPQDLATRLQALHGDPDLRDILGAAGRDFAATRTWQHQAARYRDLYEHLGGQR
jgi:D-inositol-3-phosphate glycosyltransferase